MENPSKSKTRYKLKEHICNTKYICIFPFLFGFQRFSTFHNNFPLPKFTLLCGFSLFYVAFRIRVFCYLLPLSAFQLVISCEFHMESK